jgi:putative copper export protein
MTSAYLILIQLAIWIGSLAALVKCVESLLKPAEKQRINAFVLRVSNNIGTASPLLLVQALARSPKFDPGAMRVGGV